VSALLDFSIRPLSLPTSEPMSVAQAKAHLRIPADVTEFDEIVADLIASARDYIEQTYNLRILPQDVEIGFLQFPKGDRIRLPIWPVQSLNYFHYTTAAEETLAIDLNVLVKARLHRKPAEIALRFSQVWPAVITDTSEGLQIGLTVGWETGDSPELLPRPPQINQAMRLLIGHGFNNGSAVTLGTLDKSDPLALGVDSLMANIRLY
jgi:uncharacterized phiE125 gp8 family phage protein